MLQEVERDITIIGGGISGLWALNRLCAAGYQAILLEAQALGAGQTLKSQGIIHGGLKYALTGMLTGASTPLETMPTRWKACLAGQGEIDLSAVNVLSSSQLLWSTGSLSSDVMGFLASKTLKSRIQKLNKLAYPKLLQAAAFKGQVYRLEEIVLDISSLIQALAQPHQNRIFKGSPELVFSDRSPGKLSHLLIKTDHQTLKLSSKCYLLAAGEGNENLVNCLKNPTLPISMQQRPLQMVMVKWKNAYPYDPFFGHCIDKGIHPRITITSHLTRDHRWVWYLGGELAEKGIHRSPSEQIDAAKQELNQLFPWLTLSNTEWSSVWVNRAEAKQPNEKRPDSFFMKAIENLIIAWPTKLALAPLLSDAILETVNQQGIPREANANSVPIPLEPPPLATPIWETEF